MKHGILQIMTHSDPFEPLTVFRNRLLKIGIDCQFIGNYPWIYLDSVNGIKVKGNFEGNHGFTAFFLPVRADKEMRMTDITIVFSKIRETLQGGAGVARWPHKP